MTKNGNDKGGEIFALIQAGEEVIFYSTSSVSQAQFPGVGTWDSYYFEYVSVNLT